MIETTLYSIKGEKKGDLKLPEEVFGLPWNSDLVHQVIHSLQSNVRKPIAHTKTRGDVRGGGRKPWQQKGTGRARHGSTRSPLWVGGGVTHGPRNDKNFERKVSKKMKAKALYTILSRKFKDGEVVFIDSLPIAEIKTKQAKELINFLPKIANLKNLANKKTNALYLAVDQMTSPIKKSFRNIGNVRVDEARNINPVDVATYKYLVFFNPTETVKTISGKIK